MAKRFAHEWVLEAIKAGFVTSKTSGVKAADALTDMYWKIIENLSQHEQETSK